MHYKRSSLIVRVKLVHKTKISDFVLKKVDSQERVKNWTSKRIKNEIRIVCSITLKKKTR